MEHPTDDPGFGALVAKLVRLNCAMWREEDKARSNDDRQVADAKRKLDALNQARSDAIEQIDEMVVAWGAAVRDGEEE